MALLDAAATWLPTQLQTAAGKIATLTVNNTAYTVTVVVGQIDFTLSGTGQRIEVADRDFMVKVADLTVLGLGKPEKGWQFQLFGDSRVYETLDTNTGEAAVRYTDPGEIQWRIHTKRVT